jgi:hypothetical protein
MGFDCGQGSVVLDIHLLQGYHRLGTILDAELAKAGVDMGLYWQPLSRP